MKNTTGSRSAKISQGLLWFLYLAYCHAHGRIVNREHVVQMNWDMPFGKRLHGSLLGTKAIPLLRLKVEDVLPKQIPQDDNNCGIGIAAAVGIMLRDVIGVKLDDFFKFSTIYSKTRKPKYMLLHSLRIFSKCCHPLVRCQSLERLILLF
jgi:hypothetical protein